MDTRTENGVAASVEGSEYTIIYNAIAIKYIADIKEN